jgi:hypothetical protein
MNDRQLLKHLIEAADRLSDSILFECNNSHTEWLDMPAVRRIKGDAESIQEAVAFIKKRIEVSI